MISAVQHQLLTKRRRFCPSKMRHMTRQAPCSFRSDRVQAASGDLSNSPYVDLTAARMSAKLSDDLAERGALLRLAETHAEARDILRAEDLEAKVGRIDRFTSVVDAVEHFESSVISDLERERNK